MGGQAANNSSDFVSTRRPLILFVGFANHPQGSQIIQVSSWSLLSVSGLCGRTLISMALGCSKTRPTNRLFDGVKEARAL